MFALIELHDDLDFDTLPHEHAISSLFGVFSTVEKAKEYIVKYYEDIISEGDDPLTFIKEGKNVLVMWGDPDGVPEAVIVPVELDKPLRK